VRFLDFYIPELKKWIEFNEDYHSWPYQQGKDRQRIAQIKRVLSGADCLVITEEAFLKDKEGTVKRCLDYILSS
jgi:hypothetical protein